MGFSFQAQVNKLLETGMHTPRRTLFPSIYPSDQQRVSALSNHSYAHNSNQLAISFSQSVSSMLPTNSPKDHTSISDLPSMHPTSITRYYHHSPNIIRSNTTPIPSPPLPCHYPAPLRSSLRNYPRTRNCLPPSCVDCSRGSTC